MNLKSFLLRKVVPPGSGRWRVARKLKRLLINWYYRRKYGWGQCLSQHLPNVYHPAKLNRFLRRCQATPFSWSPADAELGVLPAARVALGIWQSRPELRRQFPRSLHHGESADFCTWLVTVGRARYGFSDAAIDHLHAALNRGLGDAVLRLYDFHAVFRDVFPLALLPNGLEYFVRHLAQNGKKDHGLSDEEIWWFLFERADDPHFGLIDCYLRQPLWQKEHPHALSPAEWGPFVRWVRDKYEIYNSWIRNVTLAGCPLVSPRPRTRGRGDGGEGPEAGETFTPIAATSTPSPLTPLPRVRGRGEPNLTQRCEAQGPRERNPSSLGDKPTISPRPRTRGRGDGGEGAEAGSAFTPIAQTSTPAALTPLPRVPNEPPLGVNVLGHFLYPCGLQQATLAMVESLRQAGVATSCRDVPGNVTYDLPGRQKYLGREEHDVSILQIAPEPFFDICHEHAGLYRRPGVYRIASWYWELEEAPAHWAGLAQHVQALWVPTRFIADALRKVMPLPVHHVLPGVQAMVDPRLARRTLGLPEDRHLFLFAFDMASVMERKNPLGLIRAYRQAFRADDRTQLVIKVSRGNYQPDDLQRLRAAVDEAGALLIDRDMTRAESFGLINCCDTYVSLHRSEGFGLTMAEAMLMGKPVIATNYSGNLDFMTSDNSRLVDFVKTPITQDLPIYRKGCLWADPSIEHAAHWLRWSYDCRDEARALGEKAQQEMRELLSLEAAGRRMAERLRQIQEEIAVSRRHRAA